MDGFETRPYGTVDTVFLSSHAAPHGFAISSVYRQIVATGPEWVPSQRISHGIDTLPLSEGAALFVSTLPNHHKEPFNRMLVAQAAYGGLVLLTPDPFIRAYPVKVEW